MYKQYRCTTQDRSSASTPEFWESVYSRPIWPSERTRSIIRQSETWLIIRDCFPSSGRVLDAGCGPGHWVDFLDHRGYQVSGLDYSSKLILELRQRLTQISWSHGLVQDIPFSDEYFDVLISWGVIEHDAEGPLKALREFARVLVSSGSLFVTVPIDSPWNRRSSKIQFGSPCPKGMEKAFYQYLFSINDIKKFLADAGFLVEFITLHSRAPLSVLFPRLYKFSHAHPWRSLKVEGVFRRVLDLAYGRRDEAAHMILAYATKK